MAKLHGESVKVVQYDTSNEAGYDFVTPIRAALEVDKRNIALSGIHRLVEPVALVERETDQLTELHTRYYKNIGKTDFYREYGRFVNQVVMPLVGEPIYAQRIPTFRVHLPGNKAVGEYHKDSDFGHQQAAVNIWVPVTDAYNSNTLHVQLKDEEKPTPINVPVGSFAAFDAVNLVHGNEINTTDKTRVSFDFRIIPQSHYEESDEVSVNTGMPLTLGNYYVTPEELA